MASMKTLDTITLRNLRTTCCIGPDAWSRPDKQQPLILNLSLQLDTSDAAVSDDIANTFSYGTMCKDVLSVVEGGHSAGIIDLVDEIALVAEGWPGMCLRVGALAPKALLRVDGGLGLELLLDQGDGIGGWEGRRWDWVIRGLKAACIIGVNSHERVEKQTVVVELRVSVEEGDEESPVDLADDVVWRDLVRAVCEVVESSTFQTLEALAALIAETCLRDPRIPRINVSVEKPSALAAVEGAGVEITRDRQWMMRCEGRA